jgi:hypothetical protein
LKKILPTSGKPAIVLLTTALLFVSAGSSPAAGPFTVNNTADTHASNTNNGTDANGYVTLRSAIEAANAGGGATINVPAGIYNLSLGELDVATNGGQTDVIQASGGANSSNTIINQTDGINRVFNIDSASAGNTRVTLSGFTIQGGHDVSDHLGGAGILAGSVDSSPKDVLTLAGCVIQSNHCVEASAGYTANPGGGVQMAGGDLLVTSCTFSNNTSAAAFGGGIFFLNQSVAASLNVTNSLFINNGMTNDSGYGPDGGGAIMIGSTAASAHNITGSSFTGNYVIGTLGNTYGGAIQMNGGSLAITSSTFTSNSATGQGAEGGALYADTGTFNLAYCRLTGNSATNGGNAVFNHTANGASTTADNDWWGLNTGPAAADLGGATTSVYLKLNHYASPGLIVTNASATLTATVLTNSSGGTVSPANLGVLIGLPISFGNPVRGTISAAQAVIQPSGTATATFTAGLVPGLGSATATVDNAIATASVSINFPCPTITGSVSGGDLLCLGSTGTVSVSLTGGTGPYTVTLNNGGGSKTSASPVVLNVSPSGPTTYSVTSAMDSDGCPATVTGSASFTINPSPSATITPNPPSVCPSSSGNQASGPAGLASYSWSITNGTITSSSQIQAISYTAGASGAVSLALTVTNSSGCTSNSTAIVPVNPVPVATITPTPAMVSADSPGNQAGAPGGAASYAWSIANGVITGPTNGQTITYVAGAGGSVELTVTLFNSSGCSSSASVNVPILFNPATPAGWSFRTNYFASMTFTDALNVTAMPVAFDGTNYWSCSGGNTIGARFAKYDTNGVPLATFSPGLDFRSIFTDGNGAILARQYNDPAIYLQTAPGVFTPSGVTLTGGNLDPQASVVMNGAGTEYVAVSSGVVSRWDPDGNFLGSVALQGFGSLSGETAGTVQALNLAAFGNFWLTYNGAGIVSVWDTFGNRLANCVLSGAGTSSDSDYSFSFANGKVFIADVGGGTWRGYDVGSSGQVAIYGAPGDPSWNGDVQSKILGTGSLLRVDTNLVTSGYPVPTVTNLVHYEAVLVYSDAGFNNSTNLGNALASYVDAGGGVVVGVFGFSSGFGINGRLLSGNYLPFTESGQASPGNLTLVEDVPTSQIFTGVTSFNGGTSSYQNTVSVTSGATLLGHWSNGQPLVGVKDITPGRVVGLNFYPPSSDARTDFWVAGTSGGALMANSLLWAGHVPPVFLAGPTNQVKPAGSLVSFSVSVVGLPPLTYQWRKNGTNIVGATSSALSFTSQSGSNGLYSVTVSNSYGVAISEIGMLNPPVQFLTVGASGGGAIPLLLGTTDGSPLTAYRASRISIFSYTNVALPFSSWTQLSNPLVLSNGVLWVQGLTMTNSQSFFRASEAP